MLPHRLTRSKATFAVDELIGKVADVDAVVVERFRLSAYILLVLLLYDFRASNPSNGN